MTGKEIARHRLSPLQGQRIVNKNHYKDTGIAQKELKQFLISRYSFPGWQDFVVANYKQFQRYFREQYCQIERLLSQGIDVTVLEKAINLCLETNQYNANSLVEAYSYYTILPDEKIDPVAEVSKIIKKDERAPEVATRKLSFYKTVVSLIFRYSCMNNQDYCIGLLESLSLRGSKQALETETFESGLSNLAFLKHILDAEIKYRQERRLARNMSAAHFPVIKQLADFEIHHVEGITQQDLENLRDFSWIDKTENLLFFGPPGIGKTHLSIAIGYESIQKGYKVCFERITSLIKLLKTMDIQRSSTFRINRILKSDLLIIDEIGYTPIDRKEANLFFSLVSELYERSSIIITSNKGFESWAEMLGDEVMTTALLDRLLHHAHVFSLNGDSYRIKYKKEV